MIKKEAEITALLRKHIEKSGMSLGSCAIEMKVTKEKSLSFGEVKLHQLQALKNATKILAWKIADDSIGVKPFDLFVLQNAQAYVGVCFVVPRAQKKVYLIPVEEWVRLSESSSRKSVTESSLLQSEVVLQIVLPSNSHGLPPP